MPDPRAPLGLWLSVREETKRADLGDEGREDEGCARVATPQGGEVRQEEGVEGVQVLLSASIDVAKLTAPGSRARLRVSASSQENVRARVCCAAWAPEARRAAMRGGVSTLR